MTIPESAYRLQIQYFPLCEVQETFRAKIINTYNRTLVDEGYKNWYLQKELH